MRDGGLCFVYWLDRNDESFIIILIDSINNGYFGTFLIFSGSIYMEISKREKINILLKQIHMPKECVDTHFNDSLLERLEVYKQRKTWHFHIQVKNILPFNIYQLLFAKLVDAFQKIATVELTIYTENKQSDST